MREPDLSGEFQLDQRGYAIFPKLGPLLVAALHPDSISPRLLAEYAKYLVNPRVEVVPPSRLVITWASPSQAADPASYSRVSFDVAAYEEMVRLTVTHDELEAGSGMAKGVQQGWPIVLSSLKSLLETGQGIDVFAKPKAA